mmetsp:Transcript_24801/g.46821  ORF Transcript_24801/g.46821 Transcript_24801/m.46821 type:complete len:256 (+) Transcript_24801:114-881(+)
MTAYGPNLNGGEYSELGLSEMGLTAVGLAHSDSMEITNDPRFFQDNVINYRLAAFAGLGVVAGLMVQNSMDHLFDMKKDMSFHPFNHLNGFLQLVAFIMLAIVHFLNIVATYVGVAQPYHTIRLMTAGPTGFESSACYYLNKNIIAWRHFAIYGALVSLPLFVASSGIRMVVKFDRENVKDQALPSDLPDHDRLLGLLSCSAFMLMALSVFYVHRVHFGVFNEKYELLKPNLYQHREVLDVMTSRTFNSQRRKGG